MSCIYDELNIPASYFVKMNSSGSLDAALCVWDNKYIAGDARTSFLTVNSKLPVHKDQIALPIKSDTKLIMPWQCHILSKTNQHNIINRSFRFNAFREICLTRNK